MPSARALASLGVFVRTAFLPPAVCARTTATMASARWIKGTVGRESDIDHLDEDVRKVRCTDVGRATTESLKDLLWNLKPDLEQHFGVALKELEGPDFLMYDPGSFYTRHLDKGSHYPSRAVSVVLFLNGPEDHANGGGYTGGRLTLYGLLDGPEWTNCPIHVAAETGLLVAFRSDTVHEVQPLLSGHRYTAVGWFSA